MIKIIPCNIQLTAHDLAELYVRRMRIAVAQSNVWYDIVPHVQFAMNNSPIADSKYLPAFPTYGYHLT